uniref:Reverse transcriptase domain-containing protein n=1 Tax=Tanacetum cinerariifolium TaxID=118510 RepID=A0A699I575_TANCI|nr:reverse transcriptase domain-containing protein [Tanacetum cinerariifolium]
MEDKIEGLGNGRVIIQQDFDNPETKLQKARAQIDGLQRKQMRHNGKISLARFKISTLELIIEDIQTEVKKMEDEFYNLIVKENNLKTYVRIFQKLAVLFSNMVPNIEKLMEVFIGGLPQSIKGTVTASKPQTLEEAININQRLIDQVTKHNSVQGTNDHKQMFDDRRNTTNDNKYHNNHNNDHHQ